MSEEVLYILYDIPGTSVKHSAWSPNTWKTRFVLNYKGVPYKTEWVEYPDIAATAKRLDAPHTSVDSNGAAEYTAPMLRNVRTGSTLSESYVIAKALERDHPTPPLFPPGSEDAIAAVEDAFGANVTGPLGRFMLQRIYDQLNDASKPYFLRTRESKWGAPLSKYETPEQWAAVRDTLAPIAAAADARGESDTFLVGKKETYADFIAAAWLEWVRRMWGADTPEWEELAKWDGGRWGRLTRVFKKWEYVDDPSQPDELA
ncbi:hypothetical protein BC834DRAFT_944651 [Gloeopeniophorella convolvens]|nr:hypothetical protein BC834DRAFT_944651 [Gloeopeniophorella convolvens]